MLIRDWLHNREVSSYSGYIDQVSSILKDSDKAGAELTLLLTKPGDATRKDVQTKLDQYVAASNRLTDQAKLLTAPTDLQEAQQWFIATMQLRSRGLENLKPALLNALEVQDVEVSSDQISRAMQLLVLSDVAYDEFFVTRASTILKDRDISKVTVPSTTFITDADPLVEDDHQGHSHHPQEFGQPADRARRRAEQGGRHALREGHQAPTPRTTCRPATNSPSSSRSRTRAT